MTAIRIVIVDDHPVVLAGLSALLETDDGVMLVGEATSGEEALGVIARSLPDVAVLDISLPDLNGLELARQLAESFPDVKLLALTVHEDRAYIQPMLHNGVRGYLLKRSAAEELLRAIRWVAEGGVYLDPAIAGKAVALAGFANPNPDQLCCDLSPREEEVLKLASRGFSNKEIAGQLEISVKTVETYKARATDKLSLHSRADIVSYGASRGWLSDLAGVN